MSRRLVGQEEEQERRTTEALELDDGNPDTYGGMLLTMEIDFGK